MVGYLPGWPFQHEDTEAAVRLDTSFMLYMNTRGRTITRTLYDIPRTAQTEGGGQPQLAKGHSGHRPFVRHEGEDEDGLPGKPPEKGHEV